MNRLAFVHTVGALLTGSGAQLVGSVGSALLATLLLPIDQRGLMVVVATIASFVGLLGGAGIGNAYRRRHPSEPDPALLAADFSWLGAVLVAASGVAGAVACLIMAGAADVRLGGSSYLLAAGLAASVQVLLLLVTEARFAIGDYSPASRWAALAALAGLAGVGTALAAGGDAASVVITQAGFQYLVLVIAVVVATRARALAWARASPRRSVLLLGDGVRSLALPLAIVIVSRFDRLLLATYGTTHAVAVYALAATVVEIARLAPTAVGQLTTREVAMGVSWNGLRARLLQATVAAAVGGAVLAVMAFAAIPRVFGSGYAAAPRLAVLLLGSEVFSAVIVVANLAIIGGGWTKAALRLGVIAVLVAIPAYAAGAVVGGAFGVALARLVVFGLLAALTWVTVRRRLRVLAAK